MELPQGTKMTPMMEQYLHWKKQYPDCLLFFRMGDFYEMFFDDAKTAAAVLDIVLTARDAERSVPMAGVPFHAVDSYMGKLIAAGYRVAVCDQITEPDGKTLVQREVTRIVTPGTWLPDGTDSEGRLAACSFDGKNASIAFLISGTGSFKAGSFPQEQALSLLTSFNPNEILVPKGQAEYVRRFVNESPGVNLVEREKGEFSPQNGAVWLARKWGIATLNSMGFDDRDPAVGAANAALRYLEETQFSQARHVCGVTPIVTAEHLILDQSTQINLELIEPVGTSLFSVLNRCRTQMGKRTLKEWILAPLQDIEKIERRQDSIAVLHRDRQLSARIGAQLAKCRDVAKSVSRLTLRMGGPGDLLAIRETIASIPEIKTLLKETGLAYLNEALPDLTDLRLLLQSALSDTVPRLLRDGGVVKDGYDAELDSWRNKARHSTEWLKEYEEREKERTGIKSLKTGVNKVFGYYIEIARGGADKAPIEYTRKQTLVNAERFITEDLKNFERDMFRAEDEILAIEERIYAELLEKTLACGVELLRAAELIASLDVFLSLADVASERRYVRPEISLDSDFIVKNGRHPVIEVTLGSQPFTPNDFEFTAESGQRLAIITGPNMAGKSTYLRTAALIAIMAHMGSFVPAEGARIGIIDRVFTRIGARDELARGQSTFMVEMVETANILRHATNKSLVVLDEVGRGTSTYDGLSIAWAVVEYLHGQDDKRAKVLFATHYHELTKLAGVLQGVVNLSMAVEETNTGVTFLHKVVQCPANRSYGIEVARLAGVPAAVLRRSQELLSQFEETAAKQKEIQPASPANQMTIFDAKQEAVLEELATVNPDELTPMAALQLIYRLREESRKALGF
ncbi:DNA mismatch repair protein MutS [Synergistaceae bacterium OttesenSCG-928-D05]|nr:DNA mismatch repair protein MutS [Synergistaceae bacterium OttesenSCG-928-D05]